MSSQSNFRKHGGVSQDHNTSYLAMLEREKSYAILVLSTLMTFVLKCWAQKEASSDTIGSTKLYRCVRNAEETAC